MKKAFALFLLSASAVANPAGADKASKPETKLSYVQSDIPDQLLFGDTHLHSAFSYDAGMIGNRLLPDDAYRFAKGEKVKSSGGVDVKLRRPLDFLLLSDHAESLGIAPLVNAKDPRAAADPTGAKLIEFVSKGDFTSAYRLFATERRAGRAPLHQDSIRIPMWEKIVQAAEAHNQPGKFTTFIGYEFTSTPKSDNLHRIVMFRDGADKAGKILPFSGYESENPEDLWDWMARYEKDSSGKVIAFAHNGNLSNGLMFDDVTFGKKKLTREYAAKRQRWEPLYEVTQIKGDGETHPLLSPNDEFADYWRWDRGNFGQQLKKPDMLPREYARAALKRGLAYEAKLGVNPFKFGLIGSTDSHTGLATTDEDAFFGKATPLEPDKGKDRYATSIVSNFGGGEGVEEFGFESLASGLVAVWARENTREAIFDAMARKEVYATTGTRIRLRMFGGFGFDQGDISRPDFARFAYGKGVPMGSDLAGNGKAPGFLIQALRDPNGANLDRIQIVKGWVDTKGKLQEKVFDVSWSGDRKIGANGKLPSVGNTVSGASYQNTIGSPQLSAFWHDPTYQSGQRAFYYARVLEIPTPTWLAYDEEKLGKENIPAGAKMIHQERAYGSPIWIKG